MFKLKTIITCILCSFLLLSGSACSVRLADLSVISTRNINLDRQDLDKLPQAKRVVGKDSVFIFLFIPFGRPVLEDAIDDALDKADGDIMIDAVIHMHSWWFLVGQNTMQVKGTVVKTREG